MASISTTNSDTRKNLEQLLPEDFGDVSPIRTTTDQ